MDGKPVRVDLFFTEISSPSGVLELDGISDAVLFDLVVVFFPFSLVRQRLERVIFSSVDSSPNVFSY